MEEPRCAICGRPAWGYNKAIDENKPAEKAKFEEIYIPFKEFSSKEDLKRRLEDSGAKFSEIKEDKEKGRWVVKDFEGYLCLEHWPKCAICGRPAWGERVESKEFRISPWVFSPADGIIYFTEFKKQEIRRRLWEFGVEFFELGSPVRLPA